jgi:hypothetical protein
MTFHQESIFYEMDKMRYRYYSYIVYFKYLRIQAERYWHMRVVWLSPGKTEMWLGAEALWGYPGQSLPLCSLMVIVTKKLILFFLQLKKGF